MSRSVRPPGRTGRLKQQSVHDWVNDGKDVFGGDDVDCRRHHGCNRAGFGCCGSDARFSRDYRYGLQEGDTSKITTEPVSSSSGSIAWTRPSMFNKNFQFFFNPLRLLTPFLEGDGDVGAFQYKPQY